tara:strand:- start:315 stop:1022 length:708 start_codon:yes stop_codon:yes gene_type:complete
MSEFEGWGQTTSSDNLKQWLVNRDIKGNSAGEELNIDASSILLSLQNEEGVNIYYLREDATSKIHPEEITISDDHLSGLTELPDGIPRYSKEIGGNNYRFTDRDFIYIFKPLQGYTGEERTDLTGILEQIIQCYIQDETTGAFTLKDDIYGHLEEQYKQYIDRVGEKNLDYIKMAIKLGQISNILHEKIVSDRGDLHGGSKTKRKNSKSKKRKKSKYKTKRYKKSKSKKKRSKKR